MSPSLTGASIAPANEVTQIQANLIDESQAESEGRAYACPEQSRRAD